MSAGDETFPTAARLRKRSEFQAIQQHGRRFPTRDLIILWQEGRTSVTRLGITVSRRVAKQAARRNRIKRWIREAFRRSPQRHAKPPRDLVVIARSSAVRSDDQSIEKQLRMFWKKSRRSHRRGGA